ncbi:MAG: AI-2E family transporter [Tannerella sp.]|jgi:predicted PurR-regulated permease PerM|nr:AI-2E family transporter [Tannerella sp.]
MKEKYFKYSLIALIGILGWLIVSGLWSFVSALLGAFTIYVLLRRQLIWLTERRGVKDTLAAAMILVEVIVCLLLPLCLIVWLLVDKVHDINFDISQIQETAEQFVALIKAKTGYDIFSESNVETATGYLGRGVQFVIGQASGLVITAIVMIFILFFMLTSRRSIEGYVFGLLPFKDENKRAVVNEIHKMVRSNAIGIPLLVIIQGLVAFAGYWVAGVPSAALLGALTGFATIVPIIGTGVVWIPIIVYLWLTGSWLTALGLGAYCAIVLTSLDNVIRFFLQKKLANTHPLITFFGVFLGIGLFNFWGIVFGPLLLSMFFLLLDIFRREFIDSN